MNLKSLVGHIEMSVLLTGARVAAIAYPIGKLVRSTASIAARVHRDQPRSVDARQQLQLARLAAHRVSKLLPGTTCLHRALATRIWLSRRGVDAEIVVGFKKDGGLEGHAWLEVVLDGQPHELFSQSGYRESFREGRVGGGSLGPPPEPEPAETVEPIETEVGEPARS